MHRVGYEHMMPVCKRAKLFRSLGHTVNYIISTNSNQASMKLQISQVSLEFLNEIIFSYCYNISWSILQYKHL
jgi:hypothetical protein